VGDDITVVKDMAPGVGEGATVVWPGIFWVPIIAKTCFLTEVLPVVLAAASIDHASSSGISGTAGRMQHALGDGLEQHRMGNGIRKLSRDDGVDLQSVVDLVPPTKEYQDVDMRETTLLKLDGVNQACYFAKETGSDILQEGFYFLIEDTGDDIRTICGSLASRRIPSIEVKQGFLDLWPV